MHLHRKRTKFNWWYKESSRIWDETIQDPCPNVQKCKVWFSPKKTKRVSRNMRLFSLKIQSSTPIQFSALYPWEKKKLTKAIDLGSDRALHSFKVYILLKRKNPTKSSWECVVRMRTRRSKQPKKCSATDLISCELLGRHWKTVIQDTRRGSNSLQITMLWKNCDN